MHSKVSTSVLIFLFFFTVSTLTMRGQLRFGDEAEKYLTAQSIVERHELAIQFNQDLHLHIARDGKNYSFYELGSTLPLVPFYALGKLVSVFFPYEDPNWIPTLFVGLLNPILIGLICAFVYKFSMSLGISASAGLVTVFLTGLATVIWPYSTGLEREPLLALSLLLSAYSAFQFHRTKETKWLMVSGLFLGYLLFAKISEVVLAPFIAIYVALEFFPLNNRHVRPILQYLYFAAPIILLVGIQAAYNYVRYGDITDIGLKSLVGDPLIAYFSIENAKNTVPSLLMSVEKSVFVYSPPLLLLIPGLIVFSRKYRREALLIGSLFLINMFFYSLVAGGIEAWWGPKYMVAVTPIAMIPIAYLLGEQLSRWKHLWFALAILTGVFGFAVQIVGTLVNDREYLDVTGKTIELLGGIDFLRHRAIDSFQIQFAPVDGSLQIMPYGIFALVLASAFLIWIIARILRGAHDNALLSNARVLMIFLIFEFGSIIVWTVIPYHGLLVAKADTKFLAGNFFLADHRICESSAMYRLALVGETNYQVQAFSEIDKAPKESHGVLITPEELAANLEISGNPIIEVDNKDSLHKDGALKITLKGLPRESATVYNDPLEVEPNTIYQISGWIKSLGINGPNYAAVSISEDNGAWGNRYGGDVALISGTTGWHSFAKQVITQGTTKRLFIKASMSENHGTFWIEGLELAKTGSNNPSSRCR